MRVIAGSARGRPLVVPKGLSFIRPTRDRVREAIFDVLESLQAIEGRRVLDLFSGSGAFGIEALSRGAEQVTFVERDRRAVGVIEANLASLGLGARARVLQREALAYLAATAERPDLALADPPYDFSEWGALTDLLEAPLLVAESRGEIELASRYQVHRLYRYGTTLVTVAFREDADPDRGERGSR